MENELHSAADGGDSKTSDEVKKDGDAAPKPRVCPYCKQEIDRGATRCPHCTSKLDGYQNALE